MTFMSVLSKLKNKYLNTKNVKSAIDNSHKNDNSIISLLMKLVKFPYNIIISFVLLTFFPMIIIFLCLISSDTTLHLMQSVDPQNAYSNQYFGGNIGSAPVGEAATIEKSQRMKWLFPNGVPTSDNQMSKYLTVVKIPIKDKNGNASELSLNVHTKLSEEVKAVFQDLASINFPINASETSCYTWRYMASGTGSLSHHSYGVAIDLNATANPAVYWNKTPDPSNPYYNNENVVKIFKKHGFYWGGDWSPSYYDPMHFTYTGH